MTAVEFLEKELDKNFEIRGNSFLFDKILKQAKEIEKEQIMDAYKADLYPCSDEDAEQYYNETFKSK